MHSSEPELPQQYGDDDALYTFIQSPPPTLK